MEFKKITLEAKTVEKEGISITYYEKQGKIYPKELMRIKYLDEEGEAVQYDSYPAGEDGKIGNIDEQFRLAKALIRFDKVEANSFINLLKEFLKDRPQLSPSALSLEAGLSSRYLPMILDGDKPPTRNVVDKLRPVMLKYGFGR